MFCYDVQDVDQMLRAVAAGVADATNKQQDPYHNHNLKHHHVCLIEGASAAPAPAAPAADGTADGGVHAFLYRCDFTSGDVEALAAGMAALGVEREGARRHHVLQL